jgi:PAS domain-containing protein
LVAFVVVAYCALSVVLCAYLFHRFGTIPSALATAELFSIDVFLPIFAPWVWSEVGLGLASLVRDGWDTLIFFASIVLLGAMIALYAIVGFVWFLTVAYRPHSTFYWLSSAEIELTFLVYICVFMTRFGSVVDGVLQYVILGITVIYGIGSSLYASHRELCLSHTRMMIFAATGITSSLLIVIQMIRIGTDSALDQDFVFVFAAVLLPFDYFLVRFVYQRRMASHEAMLDDLQEHPEDFDELVKSPRELIGLYRSCFANAHPCLLSWELFVKGVLRWRDNLELWEQYMRLVAIYPEHTIRLIGIIEETKTLSRGHPYFIGVRKLAKLLVLGRNRAVLNALKRRLKRLNTLGKMAAEAQTAYWTALSEGHTDALFGVCNQSVDQCEIIESEYRRLLSEFPNSVPACKAFAQFLRVVECSVQDALVMEIRADRIEHATELEDPCHEDGIATFPNLPRHCTENAVRAAQTGQDTSQNTGVGGRWQVSDLSDGEMQAQLDAQQQSSIRELGLAVPLPFVRNLRLLALFHFVVICVLGVIVPFIPVHEEISSMQLTWSMVRSANIVAARVTEIELLLATDIAYIAEVMLNSTGETTIIGSDPDSDSWMADQIGDRIAHFLSAMNALQNSLSNAASTDLDAWTQFYTTDLTIVSPGAGAEYNLSLGAGLEYVMSQLVRFNPAVSAARESYCNETWLEAFERNVWPLVPALFEYTTALYNDQTASGENTSEMLSTLIIIAAAVNVVFAVLYAVLMRSMWLKWICIGKGLSQLPKAQIHACINRLSSRRERALIKDERLYYNDCVKMVSAAGGFGELPMFRLVCLLTCAIAASILALCIAKFVVGDTLIETDSIYVRDTLLSNMTAVAYHSAATLVMFLCRANGTLDAFIPSMADMDLVSLGAVLSANSLNLTRIIDRTTVGVADGESFGMLGSPDPEISNLLLGGPGMLFTATSTGHQFFSTSPVIFYIGLINTGLVNIILSISFANLSNPEITFPVRGEFDLVMPMHMLVHHWYDEIQDVFAARYSEYMDEAPTIVETEMCLLPLTMVVVALVVIWLFVWCLSRVERAIHFCLTSLCMIDIDVIMENTVLTNFLSGVFPTNPRDVMVESPLMKAVATVSREIVLQVRPDGVVTSANPAIEERWGVRVTDCIDVDLGLIFTFNSSVADRLSTNLDTEITLTGDRTVIPVNSLAFEVRRGDEITGYVLFIEDLRDQRRDAAALEAEIATAEALVVSVIPPPLRGKLTPEENSLTYVANWIAVMCVQIVGFDEFTKRVDAMEVLKQFRTLIRERTSDITGVTPLKSIGVSEYLLFNSSGELGEAGRTIPVIWQTCQILMQIAVDVNVQLQFGVSGESQVVMGLMDTEDLSFDIFGRVLKSSRALAGKAPADNLNVDKMALPTFPSVVGASPTSVTFKVGAVSYSAFECELVRPAPNVVSETQ